MKIAQSMRIVQCMIAKAETEEQKHITTTALRQFTNLFRASKQAHIMEAMHLWRVRGSYQIQNESVMNRSLLIGTFSQVEVSNFMEKQIGSYGTLSKQHYQQ